MATRHACGPYRVPAVDVEAVAAYTNNPPCGAMRGFGANQASFAIEGCMDLLAKECGLDAFQIRERNVLDVGGTFCTGQVLEKSVGILKTLEAVKDAYYAARNAGRAVGIGCGVKNSGIGNGVAEWGRCRLVVERDLSITLYNGGVNVDLRNLSIATRDGNEFVAAWEDLVTGSIQLRRMVWSGSCATGSWAVDPLQNPVVQSGLAYAPSIAFAEGTAAGATGLSPNQRVRQARMSARVKGFDR